MKLLIHAAANDHDCCRVLLDAGVSPNEMIESGSKLEEVSSPMHAAARAGDNYALQMMFAVS